MDRMKKNNSTGFTLIEVLLVIAILAILVAVTIIAINPAKQLAKARDAQRSSDVYSILNALHQYALDNDGAFPEELTTEEKEICRTENLTCSGLHDLSVLTEGQAYVVSFPIDPRCPYDSAYCSDNGTGYFAIKSANGRVTVSSRSPEVEESISVTR